MSALPGLGADRVHADPVAAELERGDARDAAHRPLGGRVGGDAVLPGEAVDRGDVHDRAAPGARIGATTARMPRNVPIWFTRTSALEVGDASCPRARRGGARRRCSRARRRPPNAATVRVDGARPVLLAADVERERSTRAGPSSARERKRRLRHSRRRATTRAPSSAKQPRRRRAGAARRAGHDGDASRRGVPWATESAGTSFTAMLCAGSRIRPTKRSAQGRTSPPSAR